MSPNFLSPLRGDGGSLHSERWAEIVKNLTKRGALYRNYTDDEGEADFVSSELRNAFLVDLAAGRFRIQLNFDSWTGYVAERRDLLRSLRGPAKAIVYGGDSHNAWAGILRDSGPDRDAVAVEFDGMSVTSPGLESQRPFLPPGLEAAAWQAANPDLAWADTSRRGFMLVQLGLDNHRLEYIAVDVSTPSRGTNEGTDSCLAGFDVGRDLQLLGPKSCRTAGAASHASLASGSIEPPMPSWRLLSGAPLVLLALLAAFLGFLLGRARGSSSSSRPKSRGYKRPSEAEAAEAEADGLQAPPMGRSQRDGI